MSQKRKKFDEETKAAFYEDADNFDPFSEPAKHYLTWPFDWERKRFVIFFFSALFKDVCSQTLNQGDQCSAIRIWIKMCIFLFLLQQFSIISVLWLNISSDYSQLHKANETIYSSLYDVFSCKLFFVFTLCPATF